MKRFIKMLILSAMLILSLGCISTTASAAAKTSVMALKKGKTTTIKSTSKVTSSKKTVASAKKKSSTKYKITAKKAGKTTLKVYNKNGKLSQKIYLLVYTDKTMKYNTNAISLTKGSTKKVQATVPKGCTVKYSSSDKSIAKVNSNGKITAVKKGTATIKAKVYYKGEKIKTYKKDVTVTNSAGTASKADSSYSCSYDTSALTLTVGSSKTVSASVSSNCSVKYSSSDTTVAQVSTSGKIIAIKAGTATITCKVYVGSENVKTFTKKVTVKAASGSDSSSEDKSYQISSTSMTLDVQWSARLWCTNTTDSDSIIWTSSDTDIVAILDVQGYGNYEVGIKAIQPGTATITCTINQKTSLTCVVTVPGDPYVFPDYDYELYLVGTSAAMYNGYSYCMYLKTSNPNYDYYDSGAVLVSGGNERFSTKWDDIQYIDYDESRQTTYYNNYIPLQAVQGGYVFNFGTTTPGTQTIQILERATNADVLKVVKTITFNVLDADTAESEWIDNVIAKYTDSSMDPFEKMSTISNKLRSSFNYLTNVDGILVKLTTDAGPYWVTEKWDSYISPDVLCKIADRIGEFDYIHNCYNDYSYGTSGWTATHFYCKVGIGDDVRMYFACPSSDTGEIAGINYINFNSTANLTKLG